MLLAKLNSCFKDFTYWSFINFIGQQEAEGSHLFDRFCYPDNLNHSHQIIQSEKMLIIATCRNGYNWKNFSLLYRFNISNLLKYLCAITEFSSYCACHDEIIVGPLCCDSSAKSSDSVQFLYLLQKFCSFFRSRPSIGWHCSSPLSSVLPSKL